MPNEAKNGAKTKYSHFGVAERQNRIKWLSYDSSKMGQKWRPGLFWAENLPLFLRYGLQICFAHHFLLILHGTKQVGSQLD